MCENACLLRIGTGNVELAALFAPKPMAMTAADDWTKEMMTKGYPELLRVDVSIISTARATPSSSAMAFATSLARTR